MIQEDMASLQDIYQFIDPESHTKQTSYIMQFLWRDLTSPFDVVGPYYNSSSVLESKFILLCVLETLQIFHLHGFKTWEIMCDAASPNVASIKASCGINV